MSNNCYLLYDDCAINLKFVAQVEKYYDDEDEDSPYSLVIIMSNGERNYWSAKTESKRDAVLMRSFLKCKRN